jgi:hypothetical protein
LNGAHREDFDGGWGSGMISLKESSIKQGIYSYNNFLGVLISHFLILFRFSNQLFFLWRMKKKMRRTWNSPEIIF